MENLHYQLAFSMIKGMTGARAQMLLEQIDDIEFIFNNITLSRKHIQYSAKDFLSQESLENALRKAEVELKLIEKNKIVPLFFTNNNYPFRLKECKDYPLMLYTLGDKNLNGGKILSIVGTRKSTLYGEELTNAFIGELQNRFKDLLVVSGLAYGIDIAAHKASIKHTVNTAAVLAHGLHMLYPSSHRATAKEMVEGAGVLITEFCFDDGAEKHNFLKRNRIIAGMADATLVIESADKGGALITAHLAQSYNRDVLAVPGRIGDKSSQGCNKLIKTQIASLVETTDDICNALNWDFENQEPTQGQLFYEPNEQEDEILSLLILNKEMSMNELCRALGVPISKLSALLLGMEFNHLVQSLPGNRYKSRHS